MSGASISPSRSDQILDFAEREMRRGGFDAVSFRDIATAIGIKSASVHYHFPTKGDLSAAVTRRYTDRFLDTLGPADDVSQTHTERLQRLSAAYLDAYRRDSSTCLCAVLGSVVAHLPADTGHEVRRFYMAVTDWVGQALRDTNTSLTPAVVVGLLQGAMILAIAEGDEAPLVEAGAFLTARA